MIRIKRYYINLLFSLLALMLASLACDPYMTTYWLKNTDVAGMSCTPQAGYTWKCTYTCDKPEKVGDKTQNVYLVGDDLVDSNKAGYEAKCAEKYPEIYSPQEIVGALPGPTPFNLPPVVAPPVEHFPSILTGEITYCDPSSHVMNFRLVDDFASGDYQHKVMLNGVEINCEINSSNPSLLSCVYPVNATFPADIQVWRGEQAVNEFQYDGSACFVTQKPEGNPDNQTLDCSPVPKPEGCDP